MLFTGKVVMVIDDSYTIRHQVKILLNKYDIIVVEAYDKKSMLNNLHYKGRLVDLILMDLGLKETTGFSLMGYLQTTAHYSQIPIIVLTGDATKNTVLEAISTYNVEHYAIKPIAPANLSHKVLTVLEKNHFLNHEESNKNIKPLVLPKKKIPTSKTSHLTQQAMNIVDSKPQDHLGKLSLDAKKKHNPEKYHVHIEDIPED